MKYVVAPGVCFSNHGKNYEAGAEISADVFNPKTAFDKFVEKGMILSAGGSEKKAATTEENAANKANENENTKTADVENKSTGSKKGKK
jgi:hypothetical protein